MGELIKLNYKILIPAFNAEPHLHELFDKISQYDSLENIILINDGSSDNTEKTCQDFNINYISLSQNMGKGSALKKGFCEIIKEKVDFFITLDSDLQHDPKFIPDFIAKFNKSNADIIIGNRLHEMTIMPKDRILSNKITSWLVSLLAKQKITDSQSGYRLIKTKVIESLLLLGNKYELESELLIKAGRKKFKIDSIPISTIYGNELSSINKISDTYRFIRMYFKLLLINSL